MEWEDRDDVVSDALARLMRRERPCTLFCTWRLPQELPERPTRGPPGHQRDRRQWALLLSLEFYNSPAGQAGADGPATPPALHSLRNHAPAPAGGLGALLPPSRPLFVAVGGACHQQGTPVTARRQGQNSRAGLRRHSSRGRRAARGCWVGHPRSWAIAAFPPPGRPATEHTPISQAASASGPVSETSRCPGLHPARLPDTSSLNQIC